MIVYCDCCPEKTTLAIKTCLKCELSLCEEHMKDHLQLPVFTGHPLVRPLGDLQERKCPQHEDEVLRYYCNTSRRYVCNLCALESKQLNLASETATVLRRQLTVSVESKQEFSIGSKNQSGKRLMVATLENRTGVSTFIFSQWLLVLWRNRIFWSLDRLHLPTRLHSLTPSRLWQPVFHFNRLL